MQGKSSVVCVLLWNVALAKYCLLFSLSFCKYVYFTHHRKIHLSLMYAELQVAFCTFVVTP